MGRVRWIAIVITLGISASASACAHSGTKKTLSAAPTHLTPAPQAIVIELEAADWLRVCVRHRPAEPQRYTCFEVGQLRLWAQPLLKFADGN